MRVAFLLLTSFPLLVAVLYQSCQWALRNKEYVTTTEEVEGIARAALGIRDHNGMPAIELMVANITQSFALLMKSRGIDSPPDSPLLFMRAGGWMGAWKLLYASLTEYVLIFGTAIDTSGHSGRYWADISDTMIAGRFRQWNDGEFKAVVHTAGATVLHPAWSVTGVEWQADTWMVEHAVGIIPSTLPFAFGDGLLSAQDFYTLWRSVVVYARHVTSNLLAGRF
jgi:hypothetical protein